MSRNTFWVFTLCFLAAAGKSPREVEAGDPNPVITIQIESAKSPNGVNLLKAQQLAATIYEAAGVTLDWTNEPVMSARSLTIVLTTIAAAPAGIGAESMGVAPSPGDGSRGTTAYVYIDRVKSFSATHRVASEYVLACALAHEIGHLLLPPNAHSANGIMRDSWHPTLFPPKAPGVPGFPLEQARLLRLRAQSR
jgi:hypothetical protein